MPQRVLFVCLGNICRSPTGEALLKVVVTENGLGGSIDVDSAGTGAWHVGEAPDRRMTAAAARRGYRLEGRARQVEASELGEWDLVIAMDQQNLSDLQSLPGAGQAHIRLFSDFLPPGSPVDVPDPYYGGPEGFDRVLDLVEEGCANLLEELVMRSER